MPTNNSIPPVYYSNPGNNLIPDNSFVNTHSLGINHNFGGTPEIVNNFTIIELVQLFIVYAFIIAGALSAVFIFIGGISFILSGGNDEKIKSAVNTIRYAIVGLVVTILSFTFIMIVGRIFGLNLLDYISYEGIKESINQLIQLGKSPIDATPPPNYYR